MKQILSAIILSILIHFIFFYQFNKNMHKKENNSSNKIIDKINKSKITFVKMKKTNPKMDKRTIHKTIEKKIVQRKKYIQKKYTKVNKTIKKASKRVKNLRKTNLKKPSKKISKFQKKTLENFLSNPINTQNETKELLNDYIHLYGNEFSEFTNIQKAYIKKNLPTIRSITQKYLKYPRIAIKTRQQGMSVVEFYLHPNGDISNLRLKNSSGYTALDDESIDVIKTAYKEYPKPKEKTKMIFYIKFIMY